MITSCIFLRTPIYKRAYSLKLEQLERLHYYPYYWPVHFESQVHTIDQFISDPKSKQDESRKISKISEKLKF